MGPIQAQYKGKAIFIERDDVNFKAVLDASGRDTRGQGNASATITAQLEAAGDKTHVTVTTDLTVTGKVAQFGRGVLADVSAKILTQFVDNLEQTVLVDDAPTPVADVAAEAAPAAAPAASPVAEEAPTIRKIDQPEPEAIDLLQAGSPILKRAVPVLGVAIGALIVYGLVRRRRRK